MGWFSKISFNNLSGGFNRLVKKITPKIPVASIIAKAVPKIPVGQKIGGFFSKVFPKKAGGTSVGNFLRGASNALTAGAFGNGANMIPLTADEAKSADALKQADLKELGSVVTNYAVSKVLPDLKEKVLDVAKTDAAKQLLDTGTGLGVELLKNKVSDWFKSNWYYLLIPFGLILYLIFGRKKSTSSRRRRY